jgi:hypothetical protein
MPLTPNYQSHAIGRYEEVRGGDTWCAWVGCVPTANTQHVGKHSCSGAVRTVLGGIMMGPDEDSRHGVLVKHMGPCT